MQSWIRAIDHKILLYFRRHLGCLLWNLYSSCINFFNQLDGRLCIPTFVEGIIVRYLSLYIEGGFRGQNCCTVPVSFDKRSVPQTQNKICWRLTTFFCTQSRQVRGKTIIKGIIRNEICSMFPSRGNDQFKSKLILRFGKLAGNLLDWRCLHTKPLSLQKDTLRDNVCNFRESVDSREFLNFFIFCPNNLYSTLTSKITLKLVTAFYFFRNRAKFEKR